MKKEVFRNDWHLLTGQQIVNLFNTTFQDATIQPNAFIVNRLMCLEVATLEMLEDRSSSSVYRIRQMDEVFQIFQPNGETLFFDSDDYSIAEPLDKLLIAYKTKDPVFVCTQQEGSRVTISHRKEPRFSAIFEDNSLSEVVWEDRPPQDASALEKFMRKAGAFYASYISKK